MTKLSSNKTVRRVRVRGRNFKFRALQLDMGNFSWGSQAATCKSKILDVVYNSSNNELVRTQTLVKNAIIQGDAAPFRLWYNRTNGKGKKAEQAKKDETPKKTEADTFSFKELLAELSSFKCTYSFKEVLAEPCSFKWLRDPVTMEMFKDEAKKLDDLSSKEIRALRKLLVDRPIQMGNMSKYPNTALKVFLRLLGTDGLSAEPSETLGKIELADMCVRLAKAESKPL